jgi:uncharacterized protein YkwD
MIRLTPRTLFATLAIAAVAAAGCGDSGSGTGDKDAGQAGGKQVAKAGVDVGNAIVTTNDTAGKKPKKGALDRLADGVPAGSAPGETGRDGLIAGEPDTDLLDELPQPEGLGAAQKVCAAASASPSGANMAQIGRSILCLLNAERKARHLKPLRPNKRLSRAAIGHSRNMVARHYFAHNGADGNPLSRIKRSGYIPRVGFWTVGENLAYGTGGLATPAAIMKAWMNSPAHKANILTKGFKEIGIGIIPQPPVGGGQGATFTTTFGGIRRR